MQRLSLDEKRLSLRIDVDLLLNKYVGGRPYLCRATNLSRTGLFVRTLTEPTYQETLVGLQFELPDSDRLITCAGRIVAEHRSERAHAIAFTNVDPCHQALLDAYIAQARC